jgi:MoaA/NifB/PqqE/SkfB family radical SAM enzyme
MNRIKRHKLPLLKSAKVSAAVIILMSLQYIILALWQYRSIRKTRQVLSALVKLKDDFLGNTSFRRVIFTGRKFYFNLHIPGFPSKILVKNQLGELNRIRTVHSPANRLRVLFLSITNKCPLQCKHCYEWDNLNKPDKLHIEDYKAIVAKFADHGVGQVHFGGGEPMMNYPCLLELVKFLKGKSETWLATSGIDFSYEKAQELKRSGMTGVAISVDHYDEIQHNEFRGNHNSFKIALEATENSLATGLLTCWSICLTREFISRENLYRYASLALSKGVHLIQLFEPMPAGRFKGKDVLLTPEQIAKVEEFYLECNHDKTMKGLPLVTYHGYHQRRLGCMGNGNRYLYIDAFGNLQSCPFCRNSHGLDALHIPVEDLLNSLSAKECLMA